MIDGPGASLAAISGNNAVVVFSLTGEAATIAGLTIEDGSNPGGDAIGGGIVNAPKSTLIVNECTIANNSAGDFGGGIGSFGTLSVNDCTMSQNYASDLGGAIGNIYGHATVNDSTLSDNRGGAVWTTGGTLNVRDSTLADNTDGPGISAPSGGNVSVSGATISGNSSGRSGGGIYATCCGSLTITNSTIADNSAEAGGGIDVSSDKLTVVNSTIVDNAVEAGGRGGGGLDVDGGTATLDNTIVALNTAGTGAVRRPTTLPALGSVSGSFNLIGTGGSGDLTNGTNGNQVGVANPGLARAGRQRRPDPDDRAAAG